MESSEKLLKAKALEYINNSYYKNSGGNLYGAIIFPNVENSYNLIKQDGDPNGGIAIGSYSRSRKRREITVFDPLNDPFTWSHVVFSESSFPYYADRSVASEEWVSAQIQSAKTKATDIESLWGGVINRALKRLKGVLAYVR